MVEIASPNNEQAANILNIQYSVFLGVILSFSFYVDTKLTPTVCPVIDLARRPEAVLFAIYFILDWFTANVVQQRKMPVPAYLLARVAWVAVLGATVISLNGAGTWKFVLLSLYVIISGVYDFILMYGLFHDGGSAESVRGLLFAGIPFVVGATYLIPLIMMALGRTDVVRLWDHPDSWRDMMFYMSVVYVFMKVGRFAYLAKVEVPTK